jgi:hypothetical protein
VKKVAYFRDGNGLNSTGVGNMRTETEINERTTSVDGGRRSIGDLVFDVVLLVLVVLIVSSATETERGN